LVNFIKHISKHSKEFGGAIFIPEVHFFPCAQEVKIANAFHSTITPFSLTLF